MQRDFSLSCAYYQVRQHEYCGNKAPLPSGQSNPYVPTINVDIYYYSVMASWVQFGQSFHSHPLPFPFDVVAMTGDHTPSAVVFIRDRTQWAVLNSGSYVQHIRACRSWTPGHNVPISFSSGASWHTGFLVLVFTLTWLCSGDFTLLWHLEPQCRAARIILAAW